MGKNVVIYETEFIFHPEDDLLAEQAVKMSDDMVGYINPKTQTELQVALDLKTAALRKCLFNLGVRVRMERKVKHMADLSKINWVNPDPSKLRYN